jgi:hypothetical protein
MKVKRNHKTIGFCNVGSADYTERLSENHLYFLKNSYLFEICAILINYHSSVHLSHGFGIRLTSNYIIE